METEGRTAERVAVGIGSTCVEEPEGSISISTGKKYCLLCGDNSVNVWSIERNEQVLKMNFANDSRPGKAIYSGAINPDGNSLILCFEERVRLYHILLTKLKFYTDFPIKRCDKILYSHGGQLVACKYGRGANSCITIINLIRLVQIATFKVKEDVSQMVWNQLDDELLVSTHKYLKMYKVSDENSLHMLQFDEEIQQVRIDYKSKRTMVSTPHKIYVVEGKDIVDSIDSPL